MLSVYLIGAVVVAVILCIILLWSANKHIKEGKGFLQDEVFASLILSTIAVVFWPLTLVLVILFLIFKLGQKAGGCFA